MRNQMSMKEPFIQPEVEVEKPEIPAEVKEGFESFGLNFEEEFLNLVREYNTDGILEILPGTDALGVVSAKGEEIPVHEIEEFAVRFGESHWEDLEDDGGTKVARDRDARLLIRELRKFFRNKLINQSPLFRFELNNMDVANGQSTETFVNTFSNLSISIQYDWLMTFTRGFDMSFRGQQQLTRLIPVLHQENMNRVAMLLLDKKYSGVVFDHLSLFSGLNQEVLDKMWHLTGSEVFPDEIYLNKDSFADEVVWSREEEFLEQGGSYFEFD